MFKCVITEKIKSNYWKTKANNSELHDLNIRTYIFEHFQCDSNNESDVFLYLCLIRDVIKENIYFEGKLTSWKCLKPTYHRLNSALTENYI